MVLLKLIGKELYAVDLEKSKHLCKPSICVHAKSLRSCPTLCNSMDSSLPGSSDHGTLQARILEWAAMPSFRGSSQPRDQTRACYI